MKKHIFGVLLVSCAAIALMSARVFALPDWTMRTAGAVVLVSLPMLVYHSVRELKNTLKK